MGFFSKNKKEKNTDEKAVREVINDTNENVVYRDGVFEVYEDTADGKKYGRILKYHGGEKVVEISEEEFLLWKDASENFGKYRITYERDEEFFIEKAKIELALTESPNKTEKSDENENTSQNEISEEEKQYRKSLVEYYNEAVKSKDFGEEMLKSATLDEAFSTAALSDRKINEFVEKAKKEAPEGEKNIKVKIPEAVGKLSELSKKRLYELVLLCDVIYVVYSTPTKFQHSASGSALIALSEETASAVEKELASHGQKIFIKEVKKVEISAEIHDIMMNGFRAIRFMHKYGTAVVVQINNSVLKEKTHFPENIMLRSSTIAFFQDLKNGVPQEKLKNVELVMYDSLFKAKFVQPCIKKQDENGKELITLAIIKNAEGDTLLDLYSSVENLEKAAAYKSFREKSPECSGYRKLTFDEVLKEINSDINPATGFVVDKDNLGFPFRGKALETLKNVYAAWEKSGRSFVKPKE